MARIIAAEPERRRLAADGVQSATRVQQPRAGQRRTESAVDAAGAAYDLTPSPVRSSDRRDLALEIGRKGRWANRGNLLSECERFAFAKAEAGKLIDAMKAAVAARWRLLVLQRGGAAADVEAIAQAFDFPGFEYE